MRRQSSATFFPIRRPTPAICSAARSRPRSSAVLPALPAAVNSPTARSQLRSDTSLITRLETIHLQRGHHSFQIRRYRMARGSMQTTAAAVYGAIPRDIRRVTMRNSAIGISIPPKTRRATFYVDDTVTGAFYWMMTKLIGTEVRVSRRSSQELAPQSSYPFRPAWACRSYAWDLAEPSAKGKRILKDRSSSP